MVDPFIGRAPCAAFLCLFHEVGGATASRPFAGQGRADMVLTKA